MAVSDRGNDVKLTVWPNGIPAPLAECREFSTLGAAMDAAATVIRQHSGQPWIITADGDILPPNWIRAELEQTERYQHMRGRRSV